MEMPVKNIALVTIIVLIALMALSSVTFKPKFDSSTMTIIEEPLEKNKELQIKPGEIYIYSLNNTPANITYQVLRGKNCTAIRIVESAENTGTCLYKDGTDNSSSNVTFANPSIIMLKPWMLALHENWRWNTSLYLSVDGSLSYMSSNQYKVIRTESYRGRLAYVVRENASDSMPIYEWIDADKRILLKMMGEGYEVVLAEGLEFEE